MLPTLSSKEISELERKINLPTVRVGKRKRIVPPPFTDKEMNHLIFVKMKPMRDANRKKFGGVGVKKHWTKMSKEQRSK
jgi:hypothetical protein